MWVNFGGVDKINEKHAVDYGFGCWFLEIWTDSETWQEGLNMKHKFENIWKKKEEKLKEWNKFEIKYKFENIEIQQRLKVFIYLDYLNLINSLKKNK